MLDRVIALALAAVFSGNHVSIVAGALLGAGLIKRRYVLALAVAGYIVGFALGKQLYDYAKSFEVDRIEVLLTTLTMYIVGEIFCYPVPLSLVMASSLFSEGKCLAEGIRLVSFWALTPLLSMLLALALYDLMRKVKSLELRRLMSYTLPFLTATTLGANNLALIAGVGGLNLVEVLLACCVGSAVFGIGPTAGVGYRIYSISHASALAVQLTTISIMALATALSIPMSGTMSSIYGIIAISFRKGVRMFNTKMVKRVNIGFVASAVVPIFISIVL